MESNYLILITGIIIAFASIEISFYFVTTYVNKKFQWLIIEKDEHPVLSKEGLTKFISHGYDPELGWIRKPNTFHNEISKRGTTKWTTDLKGARTNPGFESSSSKISCYGDSFVFSRQVNDNETWEYHLSKMLKTNVQNFGVGNYSIDQALIRLERNFPKNQTEIVILGVVPDTISRIVSMWKHYCEYGNTFGFKPRYILKNDNLTLIKNPIDDETKFFQYEKYLNIIRKYDFFYKSKFKKEKIHFPYCITTLKNPRRNLSIIYWVLRNQFSSSKENAWNPMRIIMQINIKWRVYLFNDSYTTKLLKKLIELYIDYSKQFNFKAVFVFLPQKDDLIFIKNHYHFYENFLNEIKKIQDLYVIDLTKDLLNESNLDEVFSDENDYGGHYSQIGNQKVAFFIEKELKKFGLINN